MTFLQPVNAGRRMAGAGILRVGIAATRQHNGLVLPREHGEDPSQN